MIEWVEADATHRRHLQQFVCSRAFWRRLKKAIRAKPEDYPEDYDFWSPQVQGLIRSLQPPARHPKHIMLGLDQADRIYAACYFGYQAFARKTVLTCKIYLLGTSLHHRGQGLGCEALGRVQEMIIDEALSHPEVTSIRITAQVHKHNEPCRRLIQREGWTFDKMDIDNEHEWWVQVGEIGP